MESESKIFNVSMRGWIVLLIVVGAHALALFSKDVMSVIPFGYSTAIGYYFGQKKTI